MSATNPLPQTPAEKALLWIAFAAMLFCAWVLMSGCNPQAKACRKAEAKVADAIHLCPSIMQAEVRVDTVVMWTEPQAMAGGRTYSQESMDSLATICANLLSVYRKDAEAATQKYSQLQRKRLTKALCGFAPIDTTDGPCGLRIWEDGGRIVFWHHKGAERVDTVFSAVERTIATAPCPPVSRVRSWSWLAFLLGVVVGVVFMAFVKGSHRY